MVDTKKTILVRLRGDLYARLEALAQKENRSIANMLDTILSDLLASHKRNPGDVIDTPAGPATAALVEDLPKNPEQYFTPEQEAKSPFKVIKTPAQAKKAVEDIASHVNFLDRKSSRLKGEK